MVSMCGLVPANNWGPKVQGAEGGRIKQGGTRQGQHRSGKVGRDGTVLGRSWGRALGHPVPGL